MEILKEYKWIIIGLGIILMVFLSSIFDSKELQKNGRYVVGHVTKEEKYKTQSYHYYYTYIVNGISYEGIQSDLIINGRQLHLLVNGKYLVVYNSSGPEESILLGNRPIMNMINLDSLNALGVDPSDFDWTDM